MECKKKVLIEEVFRETLGVDVIFSSHHYIWENDLL